MANLAAIFAEQQSWLIYLAFVGVGGVAGVDIRIRFQHHVGVCAGHPAANLRSHRRTDQGARFDRGAKL